MLQKAVYYDQDSGKARGRGELFYEIHGDGIPWSLGDGELFEHTVWTMTRGLRVSTGGAGLDVVLDVRAYSWPCVFVSDEVECTALPIMTRKRMVVFEAKDAKAEVVCFRDEDTTVEAKKSCRVNGPTQVRSVGEVDLRDGVGWQRG